MANRPIGEVYTAKVIKIIGSGAIVGFDNRDSAFLHISEISKGYVKQVGDVLKIGQEVRVEVTGTKEGKTFVSMKNVPQIVQISFEDRVQNFLKESSENLRQIQKSQDKKRGLHKRNKKTPNK